MTWLSMAIPLVAQFEGFEKRKADGLLHPYLDTLAKPAVWTRGAGRTYGISATSPAITMAEARQELGEGLQSYARQCATYAPALLTKPECLAAITSWAWNCGTGAFRVSRLRKAINEGRWSDASELIRKPNTAGGVVYRGLVRRRESERALFLLGAG